MTAKVSVIETKRKVLVAEFQYGVNFRQWNRKRKKYRAIPYIGEVRVNMNSRGSKASIQFSRKDNKHHIISALTLKDLGSLRRAINEVIRAAKHF